MPTFLATSGEQFFYRTLPGGNKNGILATLGVLDSKEKEFFMSDVVEGEIVTKAGPVAVGVKKTPRVIRGKRGYIKGVSGNPLGKPKGAKSITKAMEKFLNKKDLDLESGEYTSRREIFVRAVWQAALNGNSAAMRLIWERMDGLLAVPERAPSGDLTAVQVVIQKLNESMRR